MNHNKTHCKRNAHSKCKCWLLTTFKTRTVYDTEKELRACHDVLLSVAEMKKKTLTLFSGCFFALLFQSVFFIYRTSFQFTWKICNTLIKLFLPVQIKTKRPAILGLIIFSQALTLGKRVPFQEWECIV